MKPAIYIAVFLDKVIQGTPDVLPAGAEIKREAFEDDSLAKARAAAKKLAKSRDWTLIGVTRMKPQPGGKP